MYKIINNNIFEYGYLWNLIKVLVLSVWFQQIHLILPWAVWHFPTVEIAFQVAWISLRLAWIVLRLASLWLALGKENENKVQVKNLHLSVHKCHMPRPSQF